jgi:hypothetical protein
VLSQNWIDMARGGRPKTTAEIRRAGPHRLCYRQQDQWQQHAPDGSVLSGESSEPQIQGHGTLQTAVELDGRSVATIGSSEDENYLPQSASRRLRDGVRLIRF